MNIPIWRFARVSCRRTYDALRRSVLIRVSLAAALPRYLQSMSCVARATQERLGCRRMAGLFSARLGARAVPSSRDSAADGWTASGRRTRSGRQVAVSKAGARHTGDLDMARSNVLHPDGSDFDEFLYAFVGEDRSGSMVTVLSCLARLGLDPWKEASALAGLSEEAASTRMGVLLAKFGDVPALSRETETVAQKLVSLLPALATRRVTLPAGLSETGVWMPSVGPVVSVALFVISILILARLLIPGA